MDGARKRAKKTKPPWYIDPDHEPAFFRHVARWKSGEILDPDSGAHHLVHASWRLLALACIETGNIPNDLEEAIAEVKESLDATGN